MLEYPKDFGVIFIGPNGVIQHMTEVAILVDDTTSFSAFY